MFWEAAMLQLYPVPNPEGKSSPTVCARKICPRVSRKMSGGGGPSPLRRLWAGGQAGRTIVRQGHGGVSNPIRTAV